MKKRFTAVIVTALVCWMIITSPAWAQAVNDLKIGDADGDGKTDINDALAVALYDCGMKIQNDMTGFTMADADCSGKVDIFDALKIAEFDAGTVKTLECSGCIQPSVPGGFSAVETEDMTSVNISWNAVPWAESYRLYRDASSDGSFTEEVYAGSDTSYTDSADSECGTACYYRVLAENTCGQSAKSAYVSVDNPSIICPYPYVTVPSGLSASAISADSVLIKWGGIVSPYYYSLYRDTSATGSFTNLIYQGIRPYYTDTNLECGKTYYYKVSAVNTCLKQSPKSDSVSAATLPYPPPVPAGFAANAVSDAVNLSWGAVSGSRLYRLYKDTSATGYFTQEIYSGLVSSYTDSANLECGTTYYYKVLAENYCGQSETSDYVSAKLPDSPSTPLVSMMAETCGNSGVAYLSWGCPVTGATVYKLYRDTSATVSFTSLVYSGSDTSYIDTNLECGKAYYYRLIAENPCGQSSTDVSCSTDPCSNSCRIQDNGTFIADGLVWLKNVNCLGSGNYDTAKSKIAELKSGMCGLTDNSIAGDWRLPSKDELVGISRYKITFPMSSGCYWSSTYDSNFLFIVYMQYGTTFLTAPASPCYIWPVRSLRPGE